MALNSIIAQGPLYGHFGDPGKTGFTSKKLLSQGLELEFTGQTYTDSRGTTWGKYRTPWMVQHDSGSLWFDMDYIADLPPEGATIGGLFERWLRDVEGVTLDVDRRYGPQCVDGSKDWAAQFGADPARGYGNGVDFAKGLCDAYPDEFEFFAPNTTKIQAADFTSYGRPYGVSPRTGALLGHVAVATGAVTGGRVPVIQQDGFDSGTKMYRSTLDVNALVGIARPKKLTPVSSEPKPETYTLQPGDTFWNVSRKYETSVAVLIALNPDLDPHNLPVGAQVKVAR